MIKQTVGDITKTQVDAIVNTVNTVGVMGKGIALSFKRAFPENYKEYRKACEDGGVSIGKMFVTRTGQLMPRLIINFPTKKHWRNPSKYEYIEVGLDDLLTVIKREGVKSIAIPPLGCGNGGLDWNRVKPMIANALREFSEELEVVLYEPGYKSLTSTPTPSHNLTPARVMLLHLMRHYQMLGERITPLVVQKLAYFLQRSGEPLRLKFEKGHFGPYAHQLTQVLLVMKPHFIRYRGAITNPLIQIRLDERSCSRIDDYISSHLSEDQKARLQAVEQYISGFENAFGLELLATVDFAVRECPDCTLAEITANIHKWTRRKREMMSDHHIEVAFNRIAQADEITSPLAS